MLLDDRTEYSLKGLSNKFSVITVKKQTHNFREGNAEVEETISILP